MAYQGTPPVDTGPADRKKKLDDAKSIFDKTYEGYDATGGDYDKYSKRIDAVNKVRASRGLEAKEKEGRLEDTGAIYDNDAFKKSYLQEKGVWSPFDEKAPDRANFKDSEPTTPTPPPTIGKGSPTAPTAPSTGNDKYDAALTGYNSRKTKNEDTWNSYGDNAVFKDPDTTNNNTWWGIDPDALDFNTKNNEYLDARTTDQLGAYDRDIDKLNNSESRYKRDSGGNRDAFIAEQRKFKKKPGESGSAGAMTL